MARVYRWTEVKGHGYLERRLTLYTVVNPLNFPPFFLLPLPLLSFLPLSLPPLSLQMERALIPTLWILSYIVWDILRSVILRCFVFKTWELVLPTSDLAMSGAASPELLRRELLNGILWRPPNIYYREWSIKHSRVSTGIRKSKESNKIKECWWLSHKDDFSTALTTVTHSLTSTGPNNWKKQIS